MVVLKQVSPRTTRPFGFQCNGCGKKFTALHRTQGDAELAYALHARNCNEQEPESPQGRLA